MAIDSAVIKAFTPTDVLRASINVGNPILAKANPHGGEPTGVSVDLARAFAQRLGVPVEFLVFDSAGKSVQAVTDDQADIGFFAIDPLRGAGISFTAPYVLIEGCYLVRESSPLTHNGEVDREGVTVTVGLGSAYDLYLTRELKRASIVRAPTSPAVVDTFIAEKTDVAAGVKQQLEADAKNHRELRLLPGRFMVIQQAMGVPKGRGEAAAECLRAFVEEMKINGFVADALASNQVQGASVAELS
ncbi:periplasmic component of amino acid ABC-type transporter/signal transduction system [Polaromonas sp. CF318]|uniref:ABC transporter substrate-binding protein n=1 Tax=Polaromonas sp. CF318 TaxID=1144318 RepID=UPI0002711FA7|nr:ABC transporter substrate-binding protein [Polaromonas sp. CF318]EJL77878.1 periplasmic component of amino acid ABC-type transporter/signal transduction system [Polaromonas sp. CF318]